MAQEFKRRGYFVRAMARSPEKLDPRLIEEASLPTPALDELLDGSLGAGRQKAAIAAPAERA